MNHSEKFFQTKVVTAFAAVYLIWGSTYLAIKFLIETMPPFLSAGLRFAIAGIILFMWMKWRMPQAKTSAVHWKSSAVIGGLLLLGGNGAVMWAQRCVPSGLAALMIATVPLWMTTLEWLWLKQRRPSWKTVVGLVSGLAGVGLLIAPHHAGASNICPEGMLMLMFAALSWSIGSVYSRKAELPASPLLATAMQMICGGGLLVLLGMATGELMRFHPEQFSWKSMAAFVYLIAFGSLIGFTAYIWLLKNVGPGRASTYAFVNPLVAIILGTALAGEVLSARMAAAALLILTAVALITYDRRTV